MKRHSRRSLAALALFLSLPLVPPVHGQDRPRGATVRVVVNAETPIPKLQRDDLARIFLGKKTIWESGTRIAPAMLDEESAPMQPFLEKTLQKSVDQYRAYWKRLLFSGGGTAPRTFRTSAQVLDFVAKQPGAIGVIDPSVNDERVKTVEVVN